MNKMNTVLKRRHVILLATVLVGSVAASFFVGVTVAKTIDIGSREDAQIAVPVSLFGVVEKIDGKNVRVRVSDDNRQDIKKSEANVNLRIRRNSEFFVTGLDDDNNLLQKKVAPGKIKPGITVSVEAILSTGTKTTMSITKVIVPPDNDTLERASNDNPLKNGRAMFGYASEVSREGFLLIDTDGKVTRIVVDKNTDIVAGASATIKPTKASLSAIMNDSKVSLYGKIMTDGTVKATHIAVSQ